MGCSGRGLEALLRHRQRPLRNFFFFFFCGLLTITKSENLVHGIEDDGVLKHAVVVKFAQILDFSNSTLRCSEVILLEAKYNGFNYIVDDANDKRRVIAIQCAQQDGQQMHVAILYFSGFREYFL